MGYDDLYIEKYAKFAASNTDDFSRNEILLKVVSLARRSYEGSITIS